MDYPPDPKHILVDRPGDKHPHVVIIRLNRPRIRNAVDRPTAIELADAFRAFDRDQDAWVAILTGEGGNFCSGADLRATLARNSDIRHQLSSNMDDDGPMGVSRMRLSKPVIAAVNGYAVAGGLELALWSDIRVVDRTAQFGVLCRLRGIPLIDGGTVRLPRLIGLSRAMDLILTGRLVPGKEALQIGLAQYIAKDGETALQKALEIAALLCSHPQECMRIDRMNALRACEQDEKLSLAREFEPGRVYLEGNGYEAATRKFLSKSRL